MGSRFVTSSYKHKETEAGRSETYNVDDIDVREAPNKVNDG